jgi:hypothetical protein
MNGKMSSANPHPTISRIALEIQFSGTRIRLPGLLSNRLNTALIGRPTKKGFGKISIFFRRSCNLNGNRKKLPRRSMPLFSLFSAGAKWLHLILPLSIQ